MPGESTTLYWRSLEERETATAEARNEVAPSLEGVDGFLSRRGFLKAAGFSAAGVLLASCSRAPVQEAIPFLVKPEEITPGRSLYYASTCAGCSASCGVLVKSRDGRPIKLEGNAAHSLSRGGLCSVGQASILGFYDSRRLSSPLGRGQRMTWEEVDRAVGEQLAGIKKNGGAVRFLSSTITSPTIRSEIGRFLEGFADGRHVVYDALSCSAILDAHARTHGARILPRYRFERAEVIVSFDADFLGTWISPVEFAAAWRAGRDLEAKPPRFSFHAQIESRLSITGSKADQRIRLAPQDLSPAMSTLAALLAQKAGIAFISPAPAEPGLASALAALADRLWKARRRSLVVCGSQDVATQVVCNFVNHLLGNYGATLDAERPSYQKQGDDHALQDLVAELSAGKVTALFVTGANPVAELPGGEKLAAALDRVPLVVSFSSHLDETASHALFVCPDHHPLESWGDAEPIAGIVSVTQPVIQPLGQTRSLVETLSAWSGQAQPAYALFQESWKSRIFQRQSKEASFQTFWDHAVHDGIVEVEPAPVSLRSFDVAAVRPISAAAPASGSDLSLILYAKPGMLAGQHAENPWLQELPDPISKVAWDNYACLSPASAARLGLVEGDVVSLEVGGSRLDLPIYVQPGQHDAVVAVALGYGRKGTERFASAGPQWLDGRPSVGENGLVGVNAAPALELVDGALRYVRAGARLTKTGRAHALACTQTHHTITVPDMFAEKGYERRPVVEETTYAAWQKDPSAGKVLVETESEDLWPEDHPYTGHRWAMAVDLNACTGCSACVVACQAENNVPVVGRDEVRRHREMHWLRIDRYYSGPGGEVDVLYEPMMCQQCGNAPCETVCPVLATVHSEEGLNQQVYNRCVGTRYCANNCPYKTRRFNWFNYPREDRFANLVLNPDVTVRSRGIMEKCSFCVQRIQEAKIEAKRTGETLADGAIQTACQQTCPTRAIVFGDLNDPSSRVAAAVANPRRFRVLEEINVRPSVSYLRIVRNRDEGNEGELHG